MTTDEEIQLALAALSVIGNIIDSVRKAHAGVVKPTDVLASLQGLSDALASNDKLVDAQVDAKFPVK